MKRYTRHNFIISLMLMVILLLTMPCAVMAQADSGEFLLSTDEQETTNTLADPVNARNEQGQHIGITYGGYYFSGTYPLGITIYDKTLDANSDRALTLKQSIHEIFNTLDLIANNSYSSSQATQFNQLPSGQSMTVDNMFVDMLNIAKDINKETDGAFDPTVYRLVDLWGFSSRVYSKINPQQYDYDREGRYSNDHRLLEYPLPDNKYIKAFTRLCDIDSIEIHGTTDNYTVTKTQEDVIIDNYSYSQWIDLGGIAKGYGVDLVRELFASQGIEHYIINSGSSSMAITTTEDNKAIDVPLRDPYANMYEEKYYANLTIKDNSLSTSGLYNRFYYIGEERISHIIDPNSGYPVKTAIDTVSVISQGSAVGDAMTTALTVMGRDSIVDYMNSQHCKDNNLVIVGLHDEANRGTRASIFSNVDRAHLQPTSNSDITKFTTYPMSTAISTNSNGNSVVVNIAVGNGTTVLWWVLSILAVVVLGIVVYRRVHYPREIMSNIDSVRHGKLFNRADIAVYVALMLVIVTLFGVFVVGNNQEPYSDMQVINTMTGEILFSYNKDTDQYSISSNYQDNIVVTQDNQAITVTITLGDLFNQFTISDDGVKMTDSLCGRHQECVNNFPTINKVGQIIVCAHNKIKISLVG